MNGTLFNNEMNCANRVYIVQRTHTLSEHQQFAHSLFIAHVCCHFLVSAYQHQFSIQSKSLSKSNYISNFKHSSFMRRCAVYSFAKFNI